MYLVVVVFCMVEKKLFIISLVKRLKRLLPYETLQFQEACVTIGIISSASTEISSTSRPVSKEMFTDFP